MPHITTSIKVDRGGGLIYPPCPSLVRGAVRAFRIASWLLRGQLTAHVTGRHIVIAPSTFHSRCVRSMYRYSTSPGSTLPNDLRAHSDTGSSKVQVPRMSRQQPAHTYLT